MKKCFSIGIALLLSLNILNALVITGPTTDWVALPYASPANPDPFADQQTGARESDIVGDGLGGAHPSLYVQFDDNGTPLVTTDDTIAFRFRQAQQDNPTGFSRAAFVGVDANLDGVIDIFLGVDNSGSGDHIGIWDPGTGSNTSPSTTSIESPELVNIAENATNFDFSAVTAANDPTAISFDIDGGGGTDFFLSFAIPFQNVVDELANNGIPGLNENSIIQYIAATATQDNSLNQDLNGVDDGTADLSQPFDVLGISTTPLSFSGVTPVPEPSTYLLLALILGMGFIRKKNNS